MGTDRLAASTALDDAAWRVVGLHLAADELPPGDPMRNRLLDEAAVLRRRLAEVSALDQPHICPPSTMTVWPVTHRARWEDRNSTTSATSSGVPSRPKGMLSRMLP